MGHIGQVAVDTVNLCSRPEWVIWLIVIGDMPRTNGKKHDLSAQ